MDQKAITHLGEITSINGSMIEVAIISQSLCASCHAKGACSASDMKEKVVTVYSNAANSYSVGEKVDLLLKKHLGFIALIYAYLVPFVILLATLIISLQFIPELYAGILSLAILIPYYTVLYFAKERLQKTFTFQIEKHTK